MTTLYLTLGFVAAFGALLFAAYSIGKLVTHKELLEEEGEDIKKTAEKANEVRDNVLKLSDADVSKRLSKWRK